MDIWVGVGDMLATLQSRPKHCSGLYDVGGANAIDSTSACKV
jgi:hypothetical protein